MYKYKYMYMYKSVKTFTPTHGLVRTHSQVLLARWFNYWAGAAIEKYLSADAAQLRDLEVKALGLHSPHRAAAR